MSDVNNKYERCEDERDPCRCQGIIQTGNRAGQCFYKAVPGSKFCPMHGGQPTLNAQSAFNRAKYRLEQYNARMREFAGDDEIKSLREEIGILRMTLETLITSIKNPTQLPLFIDKITSLVTAIRMTVESTHKLEEKTNQLLDRKIVVVIADSIVQIVAQHVKDPDVLNEIGSRICASIETAASPTNPVGIGA